jgi:hypothetical protein
MATGDFLTTAKARYGAVAGAVLGFVAPGVGYLLGVDDDGLTGNEWLHALLVSVAFAASGAAAVGSVVYAVENKRRPDAPPVDNDLPRGL